MLKDIKPYQKLPFIGVVLPEIEISPEDKKRIGAKSNSNQREFLTQLCRHGFKEFVAQKIAKDKQKEYIDRIKFELETIEFLGFTNYILMVWDICKFADEKGIPRGPCRGSVGSSLVCYLIGITRQLDPIELKLFFTRFLSKARAKKTEHEGITYVDGSLCPDVDLDFDYYRRQEIIDYINHKYPGKTAKLLTTTTFTSKILIKDVLKTYENATEEDANTASALIEKEFGIPEEIEDALSDDEKKQNANFKEWSRDHMDVCEIAMSLSGLNRSEGQHASAVLICHDKIDDLMPLQLSKEKETISSFDMYSAQEICLKFDILGLKNLSVIDDCCKLIGIKKESIDIHDNTIYQYLQDFKYRYGIFQLESEAQGQVSVKIHPVNFVQMADCLAISRPGAVSYLGQYLKYIHEGEYKSIHPLIDDILKPTGGVCLFQEQYLAMLVKIGMTPDEAENARKVLGKKQKEKVPEVKAKIAEVCTLYKHPPEIINLLLKIAEDSGGYQFSLVHASGYAIITCQTLWLKIHHPLEYYWALLRMTKNSSDSQKSIATIEKEMKAQGFSLLPPHLIKSDIDFKIEGKGIRFALGSLRGVSDQNVDKLRIFKNEVSQDKFSLFQSLKNCGINIGIGSSLVQCGCLEGFGNRARVVLELQVWNILTDKEKNLCLKIGKDVGYDVFKAILYLKDNKDEKGKNYIKESRFETIKTKKAKYQQIYELNSRNEKICNYYYEKTILGYSYSENITSIYEEKIDDLISTKEIQELENESNCKFIGFAANCYKSKTKAGNSCFSFDVADDFGQVKVKMFNQRISNCEEINGRMIEDEDCIIVEGKKMSGDVIFANKVGIQTKNVYMRLSELKG
jgi:DNA polymerase III subunit alpha